MNHRIEILNAVKSYCEITKKSPATIATKVMNDGKFFDRLEAGGSCTMRTYEKVMQWFILNTPKSTRRTKATAELRQDI